MAFASKRVRRNMGSKDELPAFTTYVYAAYAFFISLFIIVSFCLKNFNLFEVKD